MSAEVDKIMLKAYEILKQLRPHDNRPLKELKEADFDVLVTFWSR